MHLCVNPDFHRWQQRYVALSGSYQAAPVLTPAYSAILVRGEGPQRQIERVPLPDIRTALTNHAKFILLAQPGAGKTTVLQRIALDKALGCWQGETGAQLPLFVRLAAQQVDETPQAFLARMWQETMPGGAVDGMGELRDALRKGRLCLLVDAINEARREHYTERMHDWRDFAAALPAGNHLIFSCRTLDYAGEMAVQQVEIDPLTPPQIEDFAVRYLDAARGAAFWKALQERHGDLRELAATPYYLHMLVEVFEAQGDLPANRALLFEQFVTQLFDREKKKRHAEAWIDEAAQHLALSELAFAMQEVGAGTQVKAAWAKERLPAQVTLPPDDRTVATPPADVLALARAATFLAGDGKVKFTHHLMQEYFAAEALLRRLARGEDLSAKWRVPSSVAEMPPAERGEWDALPGPPTSGWEETTILAAGLYPAVVYEAVQPVNVALAARSLLESGEEADATRIKRSQEELLARLGSVAVHVRSRIEAGLLLGKLGDPRFPAETVNGVKVILPPMVEIAGGKAKIGSDNDDDLADSDEKLRHTVMLAPYAIGCFPVTNAEYACFMAAGGYTNERYWTDGGRYWLRGEKVPGEDDPADWWLDTWKRRRQNPQEIEDLVRSKGMTPYDARNWRNYIQWSEADFTRAVRKTYPQQTEPVREPRLWQDPAFNNLSQPVVGLCWYEAMAYTNWLAIVTCQPYRLPTEPEWEWAARRGGRRFPWGNDWDTGKLNSLEGEDRVMRTTPVGAYPQGATPEDGIFDLSGNVWEWTATKYAAYPYKLEADLENPDATGSRIARGGGWAANRKMVRCAYRYGVNPWIRDFSRGFRLARTLS
jgi:formylglycine-generating enzyme required for sulfatase activity